MESEAGNVESVEEKHREQVPLIERKPRGVIFLLLRDGPAVKESRMHSAGTMLSSALRALNRP
jgi:hypothetical protein